MMMDSLLLVSHVLINALLVMLMVDVTVVVTELKMILTTVSAKLDIMKIPPAVAHLVAINVQLVLIHQLVILVPVTDLVLVPHLVHVNMDIMITVPTMLFAHNVLINVMLVPDVTELVILVLKTDLVLHYVTVMQDIIYLVLNV
jgi:hypothetical protein